MDELQLSNADDLGFSHVAVASSFVTHSVSISPPEFSFRQNLGQNPVMSKSRTTWVSIAIQTCNMVCNAQFWLVSRWGLVVQGNPGSEPWRPTCNLWILDCRLRSDALRIDWLGGNSWQRLRLLRHAPAERERVDEAWKEDLFKHDVPNQFLITDSTICQPDLNRSDWTILNRYRTGNGRCAAAVYDWCIRDDPFCVCGGKQTMSHIVNECPLTKYPGGIQALHTADEDAIKWLHKFSIC